MFVKYTINPSTFSGTTGSSINIPINLEYQIVDNAELVERLFVSTETQKSVNPILDYEKVRFTPLDFNNDILTNINYNLFFLDANNSMLQPTYYSDIGFDDSDIKQLKNNFTESYILLSFYDTDNALTQNLIAETAIFNRLSDTDYYPSGTTKAGQPKPASQIPTSLKLTNPVFYVRGFHEGFYLYDYRDEYIIAAAPKYLYMKATYFNGKTGKFINMMTDPSPYTIDVVVKKLHTRYELSRNSTSFYYQISDTYSTNVQYSNTSSSNKSVSINLYQIQTL